MPVPSELGQRRDGRRLIGLDRFLEIGIGNTRNPQCGLAWCSANQHHAQSHEKAGGLPLVLRDRRCREAVRDTTGRRLDYVGCGNMKDARANNFQPLSCFCQTCRTPILVLVTLPSSSLSAVASLGLNRKKLEQYLIRFTANTTRMPLLRPLETFRRLQGGIAHFISNENAVRDARGLPPWDNGMFDVDALNAEGDGSDDGFARNLERMAAGLELLDNPWGAESVIESAATAAEWAESGADLSALRAYAADTADPELAMYKNCLARGLDAIPADDLPQFAFTFIALCELALHAPLLPQHATLRAGRVDPRQLFPALRFQMLLGPVGHIRPPQGLADVARLNLELCRALDWVHPTQIIAAALEGPETVADRRSQRYIWAQAERARGQQAFTDLLRRAFDPSAGGEEFRHRYAFPVIEYADRTFYMGDKDALWWLTTQHLLTMTMRQIILGTTLTVVCPYRGAPAEAETLTTWLRNELQTIFGRPFPMARVASR